MWKPTQFIQRLCRTATITSKHHKTIRVEWVWPEDNKQTILYPYYFTQLPSLTMYIHSLILCNMFLNVVVSTVPLMWQTLRKDSRTCIGILTLFTVRFNARNTEEQSQNKSTLTKEQFFHLTDFYCLILFLSIHFLNLVP